MANAAINPSVLSKVIAHPAPAARGVTSATIRPSAKIKQTPSAPYWPDPYKNLWQKSHPGHVAWDIEAPTGTPVYAPVQGTVVSTKAMDPWGWGNSIEIVTPDGFHLFFAHLSEFLVKPGQFVTGGQQIGLSGNTFTPGVGHSSGPHLHFEVRTGESPSTAIDPAKFLAAEALSTAMPAYGTTLTLDDTAQAIGAPQGPMVDANTGAAAPNLESPSASADHAAAGSTQGTAKTTAGMAAPTKRTTPEAAASTGTPATAAATPSAGGETAFVTWNLVDSPVLGKISFKLTPKIVALVLGSVLLLIGLFLTGFETVKKADTDAFKGTERIINDASKVVGLAGKTGNLLAAPKAPKAPKPAKEPREVMESSARPYRRHQGIHWG